MGKQRKFSPSERNFAWQHKKTAVCETVIKLVYHIVFLRTWRGSAPKPQHKGISDDFEGAQAISAGKKTFSHRVRIHPFAKLHYESEI